MATRTKKRRRNAASRTPQRTAKGRFKKGSGKRRSNSTRRRARNKGARRTAPRRRNPVARRKAVRRKSARRRRNASAEAFAASIDRSSPRVANGKKKRRKAGARRRKNMNAFSASIFRSAPRTANGKRRRNGMRRRRNEGVVGEVQKAFTPQFFGKAILGSSIRGLAGGASMTAMGALWNAVGATVAANPLFRFASLISMAGLFAYLSKTKMVGDALRKVGGDPDDISRGVADQLRDVTFLTISQAAPAAAPYLGMLSPAVAAQIAMTPTQGVIASRTAGTIVQTTAGRYGAPMGTRGLSVMGEYSDGPDQG